MILPFSPANRTWTENQNHIFTVERMNWKWITSTNEANERIRFGWELDVRENKYIYIYIYSQMFWVSHPCSVIVAINVAGSIGNFCFLVCALWICNGWDRKYFFLCACRVFRPIDSTAMDGHCWMMLLFRSDIRVGPYGKKKQQTGSVAKKSAAQAVACVLRRDQFNHTRTQLDGQFKWVTIYPIFFYY